MRFIAILKYEFLEYPQSKVFNYRYILMPKILHKRKKFIPGKDWVWYAPNTHDVFGEPEIKAVTTSLRGGWLTTGKNTALFEEKIAKIFGKKYGLFVNSGSSANLLALETLRFPKGSEVITPACNFNTTVSPLVRLDLIPVFVDIREGMYTLDPDALPKALSKKTVAIIAPHLIGNFIDLPRVRSFAKKNNLILVEDSCDTIGGTFQGKPSGAWSDITTTSFYASHLVTAGGAGGMLMTNDKKLLERARVFRDWGRGIKAHDESIHSRLEAYKIDGRAYDSAFVFSEAGYNFRPTDMQAAFGLAQLARLKGFAARRQKNFSRLTCFFKNYEDYFILPYSLPKTSVNWLAFALTIKKGAPFERNDLVRFLEDNKIQTRPLFSGNIVKHPAYSSTQYRKVGDLPNAQLVLENALLIGLHHGLTDDALSYMEEIFEKFLREHT